MNKGKLIGQGRTAEIYSLPDEKILKLFRKDMPNKSVEKEFKLGRILTNSGIPAPAIHEMISLEGRQGIVCQYAPGETMLNYIAEKPFAVRNQARSLAQLQHEVHQHTVTELPSQKEELARAISEVKMISFAERQKILDYLSSLPSGNSLCHGDFHPDNVMVSPEKAVVIDWMNASSGNPAGDVARTILLLRDAAPPPGTGGWKLKLLQVLRKLFYRAYTREYYKISTLKPEEVEAWTVPVAAARLSEDLPQEEKRVLLGLVHNWLGQSGDGSVFGQND